MVLGSLPDQEPIYWSIAPCGFLLKILNIFQVFEVLITVIILQHILVNLSPNFSFNLWVFNHFSNHENPEISRSIRTSPQKDDELF